MIDNSYYKMMILGSIAGDATDFNKLFFALL